MAPRANLTQVQRELSGLPLANLEEPAIAAGFNPATKSWHLGFPAKKKLLLSLDAEIRPSFYFRAYQSGVRMNFDQRYSNPDELKIFMNPQRDSFARKRTEVTVKSAMVLTQSLQDRCPERMPAIETALRDKLMYSGTPANTLGRFQKYYPKKGDPPISARVAKLLQDDNYMSTALSFCGIRLKEGVKDGTYNFPAAKRIPYTHIPAEESISVSHHSSLGLPTLTRASNPQYGADALKVTMGLSKTIMQTTAEMFFQTTGMRPLDFSHEYLYSRNEEDLRVIFDDKLESFQRWMKSYYEQLKAEHPELVTVLGKAKAEMTSIKKVLGNEIRFYNVYPGHFTNIFRTVLQPLREVKDGMKYEDDGAESHTMLGSGLANGDHNRLVTKLLSQLGVHWRAYSHNGDDSWVIQKIRTLDGELTIMYDLDCSSFDLTQRSDLRDPVIDAIYEQLMLIEPMAATWWMLMGKTRLTNVCDSFVMDLHHGGPSGFDGQSEINDVIMQICIDLALNEVHKRLNFSDVQYESSTIDEVELVVKEALEKAMRQIEEETRLVIKLGQLRTCFMPDRVVSKLREFQDEFVLASNPIRRNEVSDARNILAFNWMNFSKSFDLDDVFAYSWDGMSAMRFPLQARGVIKELEHVTIAAVPHPIHNRYIDENLADMVTFSAMLRHGFIYLGYEFGDAKVGVIYHTDTKLKMEGEMVLGVVTNIQADLTRAVPSVAYPGPRWIKGSDYDQQLLIRLAGQALSLGGGIGRGAEVISTFRDYVIHRLSRVTIEQVGDEIELNPFYLPDDVIKTVHGLQDALLNANKITVTYLAFCYSSFLRKYFTVPTNQVFRRQNQECEALVDGAPAEVTEQNEDCWLEWGSPGEDEEIFYRPISIDILPVQLPHGSVSEENFGETPPTAVWGPDKPKRPRVDSVEDRWGGMSKTQRRNRQRKAARERKLNKSKLMDHHDQAY